MDNNKMPTKLEYIFNEFKKRDIEIKDLAILVLEGQKPYIKDLDINEAIDSIMSFISKREVQHSLLTAFAIDNLAIDNKLPEPLQSIISEDSPFYGIDETLAIETASLAGSIATSNFGYLDKSKPGIIGKVNDDQQKGGMISTMLDDQLCAIVAAAESKLAHNHRH